VGATAARSPSAAAAGAAAEAAHFELYAQRDPLYREVADVVVDGGRLKPAAMLARVEEAVRDYRSGKGEGAVVAEGERDA